ncbi:SpvB/TcaC N-terminal domain-containing protein [Leptospira johnsonii]|uniref:Virulence plasmid 65kDa B protein n=1 Tax=Leptospira johnsonii TaxID=1917820 RepID=A0A2P2D6A6_9LEPT|nr:SpvB/TcaC N-terminal domain-containing protein [Leptospira johnsonii]GBF40173.1 virulence plasmid 65kDa B protein [Leptospira johnsonii]
MKSQGLLYTDIQVERKRTLSFTIGLLGIKKNRKKKIGTLLLFTFFFLTSCVGGGSNPFSQLIGLFGTFSQGISLPSPGSAPAPEGSDLFSISTNYSQAIDDPATKADALSGAAFIAPPEANHFGAVSLNYPIQIPPGRAGIQPSLALSYSSTGGDGWAGMGWNIGLGAITRTPEFGALFYDSRDIFNWNGKRLIKVSGSTSNENGIYRPEITEEDFTLLKLTNIETGGTWEVLDSSGTKTIYGDISSKRIYDPSQISKTYSWYLSKMEDRNGNYMEVVYDTSQYSEKRNLYIQEIKYTGNSRSGVPAKQYVRFITKARGDSYVSKAPGFTMVMDRLLDKIEVGWTGGKLWTYSLIYNTSFDSGRPILKTVESDRHTTKPEFKYSSASRVLVWQNIANQASSEPELQPESTQYFEGDFNGDAISDVVFFNPQTGNWKAAEGRKEGGYNFKTYANRYKNYDSPSKIRFFKGNVSGDFNGDGRSDIAFYLPETRDLIVAEHNGQVFQFRNYGRLMSGIPDIFRMEWFPGDYDGNGLSDSLLFDEPTGLWTLMLNKGGNFEFLKIGKKFQNVFRGDYSPNGNLDSASTNDTSSEGKDRSKVKFLIGDYNSDGLTDISLYDARTGKWFVGENLRNPDKADPVYFKTNWVLYKTFTAPEQTLFSNDEFSGDFNGDGTSDFLLFDRSSGEWVLGATQNQTINFKIWSKAPQFKTITRWLQGDFNGDGRTDIGFFSASDGKFWIGEATLEGFRYKIYSDMSYGPDQERVMQTPLPLEEVKLTQGFGVFSAASESKTILLDYQYDGNLNPGKGEIPYAGCFTQNDCSSSLELLLYDRKTGVFDFKKGSTFTESVLTGFNPETNGILTINNGKPDRYTVNSRDEVLFFGEFGTTSKFFVVTQDSGTAFKRTDFASVSDSQVVNFDINSSGYAIDNFDSTSAKSLLVLNDQTSNSAQRFFLTGPNGTSTKYLSVATTTDLSDAYFPNLFQVAGDSPNRSNRNNFSIFSGDFIGSGKAQILIVDRRNTTHKWYLGTIGTSSISFKLIPGTVNLPVTLAVYNKINPAGIQYALYPETVGNSIVFEDPTDVSTIVFSKIKITSTFSFTRTTYSPGLVGFSNQFDHRGNPIVISDGENKIFDLSQNKIVSVASPIFNLSLTRPDLISKVYPFDWIQGDYNGDGLTDIGIIHLKESSWYFAMSTGSVPDVVEEIKNGIGGTYTLEYDNSTKFDNNGGDNIPDLSINYRVCTKITLDDGLGNKIPKEYSYKNGVSFSAFINGKKETDAFGFTEFTLTDATHSRTVHSYFSQPYSNFMHNRALGGAEKEVHIIGSDNQDYGYSKKSYEIQQIETVAGKISYLARLNKTQNYISGTPTTTSESSVIFNGYNLTKKTDVNTDHYADSAHVSQTFTSVTDFETDSTTNQTRPKKAVSLSGSSHETTSNLTYDSQGNLIRNSVTYTGSGLPAVTASIVEYEYDTYGNRTEEKNVSASSARGISYAYDDQLHQFIKEKTNFGGSLQLKTRYTTNYGKAFGSPDDSTDPNGNKAYFDYDDYGRLVESSADTDSGIKTLANYSYSADFPLSAKTVFPSGNGDPDFATRSYKDGMGRVVQTVKTASSGQYVHSGKITYNGNGQVSRMGQPDWANASELETFTVVTQERNPTYFEYDAIGRTKKAILPIAEGETEATTLTNTYNDPFEIVETHSGGTSKRTIKDGRGQVLYIEDFGSDGTNAKIGFCFDLAGKLVKKSDLNDGGALSCDPSGINAKDTSGKNQAYWLYDAFGRLKKNSDPDFGVSTASYNAFGDTTQTVDARGITTSFTYDSLGRMITKDIPEGTVHFDYDSGSGSENALGKLVRVEDSAQIKTFSYDKLGRTKKETRNIKNLTIALADGPYITDYKYDLLGRVTSIDYPEHPVSHTRMKACYTYGTAGYITGISVQVNTNGILPGSCSKTIVENIAYNEFGQTLGFGLGNGVQTNYTYDVKQRLVRINSVGDVDGTTKTLQDAVYAFNSQNNITGITNNSSEYTTAYNYSYDGLSRLVAADGQYQESADNYTKTFRQSFAYAKNGNLLAKRNHNFNDNTVIDEWNYQYSNHQVTHIDSTQSGNNRLVMNYDAVGNMTYQRDNFKDLTKTITIDSQNRITQVQDALSNAIGNYWYDEGGFRVRKKALVPSGASFKTQEILYPSKFYGLEYSEDTNILSSINNVYLNGVRIAALNEEGTTAYFLTDQVDSVAHVLDEGAHTLSRMQYEPYGETLVQRGNLDFAPKYNSQELDRETNFYFYNARYYDPQIARFTSADSVIDGARSTQGWNRFSYVAGNPIKYKDPTGHILQIVNKEKAEVDTAIKHLSSLAGAKVSIDSKGNLQLGKRTAENTKNGYELVRRLIADTKHTAKLIINHEGLNEVRLDEIDYTKYNPNLYNGKGVNTLIYIDPDNDIPIAEKDDDGLLRKRSPTAEIKIAHEFIHSGHFFGGKANAFSFSLEEQVYKHQEETWFLKLFGIDEITRRVTDEVKREELRTVGLKYVEGTEITENMVRKERNEKLRMAY